MCKNAANYFNTVHFDDDVKFRLEFFFLYLLNMFILNTYAKENLNVYVMMIKKKNRKKNSCIEKKNKCKID